jgi:DNA repair exonuclease SbcCD ATPase subunit
MLAELRELRAIVTEQWAALAEQRAAEQRELQAIVTEHRAALTEQRAALTEQMAALAEVRASKDKQQAAFAAQSVDVGDALAELRASNDKQQAVFAAQKADVGELALTLQGTLEAVVDGLSGFGTRQQELQNTNGHVMTMLESLAKLAGHLTRVLTDTEKLHDLQMKWLEWGWRRRQLAQVATSASRLRRCSAPRSLPSHSFSAPLSAPQISMRFCASRRFPGVPRVGNLRMR